jgi:hypothetical protein
MLLDPAHLRLELDRLRAAQSDEQAAWRMRLQILDEDIDKHERLLRRAMSEKLKVEPDDPRYAMYDAAEAQEARTVKRLRDERPSLEAASPGLSDADVRTLEDLAAEIAVNVETRTPEQRRRIFQAVRLRGVVRFDPEHGARIGRKNHFTIQWGSLLSLPDSAAPFLKHVAGKKGEAVVTSGLRAFTRYAERHEAPGTTLSAPRRDG